MLTYKKACEIRERMCETYKDPFGSCAGESCPMRDKLNGDGRPCKKVFLENTEKAEPILTDWDEKHPIRTILDEFKENYPNAPLNKYGTPSDFCPTELGYETDCSKCPDSGSIVCWSRPAKNK